MVTFLLPPAPILWLHPDHQTPGWGEQRGLQAPSPPRGGSGQPGAAPGSEVSLESLPAG